MENRNELLNRVFFNLVKENTTEREKKLLKAFFLENTDINYQSVEDTNNTPLHTAMLNSNEELVIFLIENGADTTIRNYEGMTPLDYIGTLSSSDKLKVLLLGIKVIEDDNVLLHSSII